MIWLANTFLLLLLTRSSFHIMYLDAWKGNYSTLNVQPPLPSSIFPHRVVAQNPIYPAIEVRVYGDEKSVGEGRKDNQSIALSRHTKKRGEI